MANTPDIHIDDRWRGTIHFMNYDTSVLLRNSSRPAPESNTSCGVSAWIPATVGLGYVDRGSHRRPLDPPKSSSTATTDVRVYTRRGREVVVPYLDGTTGFSVLQNELNGRSNKTRHGRLLSSPTITANRTAVHHHHPPPFLEALPVGRFCSIGPSPAKMNSLGLYTGLDMLNQTLEFVGESRLPFGRSRGAVQLHE
jgi:hypothetical protein